MNFLQNLFSTFLGAVLGFVFSIILYYFVENQRDKKKKNTLQTNLIKEFEYNIFFLNKLENNITKILEKINGDNRNVFIYLNYSQFQTFFLQMYFQAGLMFNKFEPENIAEINALINRYNLSMQSIMNQKVDQWNNSDINKANLNNELTIEKDFIEQDIKKIKNLLKKIKEKKNEL